MLLCYCINIFVAHKYVYKLIDSIVLYLQRNCVSQLQAVNCNKEKFLGKNKICNNIFLSLFTLSLSLSLQHIHVLFMRMHVDKKLHQIKAQRYSTGDDDDDDVEYGQLIVFKEER